MGTATNVYALTLIVYCLIVSNATNLARAFSASVTDPENHKNRVTSRDIFCCCTLQLIRFNNASRSQLYARTLNFVAVSKHYKYLNIVLSSHDAEILK